MQMKHHGSSQSGITGSAVTELTGSGTFQNLVDAFTRESQILSRYHLFARTAEYEGFSEVADLFKKLEQNQVVYIQGHLDFLRTACDPISGLPFCQTSENLAAAIAAEQEQATAAYPAFSCVAETEGFATISSWFQTLVRSKAEATSRIQAALEKLVKVMPQEDQGNGSI